MKTNLSLLLLTAVCVVEGLVSGPVQASTITLTAEVDKPYILVEPPQTVYLRIGLTGCPLDELRERPPVNVALVIDKSGSMSGERIRHAREAAILALHRLGPNDIVSVVTFDSGVQVLVPATKMTRRDDIVRRIRQIEAGGTTALYGGVQAGAHEVQKFQSPGRVNRIVLLSDGHANVGPQTPEALGRLGSQLAEKGLSVTTIGLGLSYNEDLMSRLAYRSEGSHYFAESPGELASVFDREFDRALSVVAQEIRIEITLPKGVKPLRILGREGRIDKQTVAVDMGNVYSEHEKYVLLEAQVTAVSAKLTDLAVADVKVQYRDMKNAEMQTEKTRVAASLTKDTEIVEKHLNKRVAANVVEQIAILENERATALRDEGKVEQARQVLMDNAVFLRSNAVSLDSAPLEQFGFENEQAAGQMQDGDWGRTRKALRESQTSRRTQQ